MTNALLNPFKRCPGPQGERTLLTQPQHSGGLEPQDHMVLTCYHQVKAQSRQHLKNFCSGAVESRPGCVEDSEAKALIGEV